jgi:hypothetical protein
MYIFVSFGRCVLDERSGTSRHCCPYGANAPERGGELKIK